MNAVALAINLFLSATVVSIGVAAWSWLGFRRHPAARYFLALGGLLLVIALPLAAVLSRKFHVGWEIPLPSFEPKAAASSPGDILLPAAATAQEPINWLRICVAAIPWVWLAGALVSLLRWALGLGSVRKAIRDARPLHGLPAIASAESRLGLKLDVLVSRNLAAPYSVGIWRPKVFLPETLIGDLSKEQLEQVLLHEGAHIALGHSRGLLVQRLATALLWPNPFVRILCRGLAAAREEVCDNFASQVHGATCYARTLLAIAERAGRAPHSYEALAFLGPELSLEHRIAGLLSPRRNRMIHLGKTKAVLITGLLSVVLASAAVQVRPSQTSALPSQGTDSPRQVVLKGDLKSNKSGDVVFTWVADKWHRHGAYKIVRAKNDLVWRRYKGKSTSGRIVLKYVASPSNGKLSKNSGSGWFVYVDGEGRSGRVAFKQSEAMRQKREAEAAAAKAIKAKLDAEHAHSLSKPEAERVVSEALKAKRDAEQRAHK